MTYYNGFYTVIQYCPDRGRAESANIGIVLICPELQFAKAMTDHANKRVRAFFGKNFDAMHLDMAKLAIEESIDGGFVDLHSAEDLDRYASTRAGDIRMTPARSVQIADPEIEMQRLFDSLLHGSTTKTRPPREKRPQPTAFTYLDDQLRPLMRDHKVVKETIRLPLIDLEIDFPYTYQNGTRNYVRPLAFNKDANVVKKRALEIPSEWQLVQKHSDGRPRSLIVLTSFAEAATAAREPVTQAYLDFGIRVFDESEVHDLVNEIVRDAH